MTKVTAAPESTRREALAAAAALATAPAAAMRRAGQQYLAIVYEGLPCDGGTVVEEFPVDAPDAAKALDLAIERSGMLRQPGCHALVLWPPVLASRWDTA